MKPVVGYSLSDLGCWVESAGDWRAMALPLALLSKSSLAPKLPKPQTHRPQNLRELVAVPKAHGVARVFENGAEGGAHNIDQRPAELVVLEVEETREDAGKYDPAS